MAKVPALKKMVDLENKMVQIGISIIFMKEEVRQGIDVEYGNIVYKYAALIQKTFKGKIQRDKF